MAKNVEKVEEENQKQYHPPYSGSEQLSLLLNGNSAPVFLRAGFSRHGLNGPVAPAKQVGGRRGSEMRRAKERGIRDVSSEKATNVQ